MQIKKIIKYVYVSLTIYGLYAIEITTLKLIDILPAIILMWITYLIFMLPYFIKNDKKTHSTTHSQRKNLLDNKLFIILTMMVIIFSLNYAMIFYTGNTIINLFSKIATGNINLYADYQSHHGLNDISTFTLAKVPFIIMLFIIKFSVFSLVIEVLLLRKKRTILQIILLLVSISSHLLFGIARGTNFELFELLVLTIFVVFQKYPNIGVTKINKQLIFILVLAIISAILFYNRIEIRTGVLSFEKRFEYKIDEKSFILALFGNFGKTGLFFYDYFTFGFYYTSRFITEVVFDNINNLIVLLYPKGFALLGKDVKSVMLTIAPRNNRWYPNIVFFTDSLGILLTIIYVIILGYMSTRLDKNKLFSSVLGFLILLQMFTMPIGDLVYISSATTLTIITTIGILISQKLFINSNKIMRSHKNRKQD